MKVLGCPHGGDLNLRGTAMIGQKIPPIFHQMLVELWWIRMVESKTITLNILEHFRVCFFFTMFELKQIIHNTNIFPE